MVGIHWLPDTYDTPESPHLGHSSEMSTQDWVASLARKVDLAYLTGLTPSHAFELSLVEVLDLSV